MAAISAPDKYLANPKSAGIRERGGGGGTNDGKFVHIFNLPNLMVASVNGSLVLAVWGEEKEEEEEEGRGGYERSRF